MNKSLVDIWYRTNEVQICDNVNHTVTTIEGEDVKKDTEMVEYIESIYTDMKGRATVVHTDLSSWVDGIMYVDSFVPCEDSMIDMAVCNEY